MAPDPKTVPSPKSSQPPRKSPPPPSSPPPTKKTSRREFDSPPGHVVRNQSTPPAAHKSNKSPSHKADHDKSVGDLHTRFSNASYKEIVLALVVAAIVFVLFIIICVSCAKRRRRKKRQKAAAYYNKTPPAGSGDYYNKQWADSPHEYVIQFTRPGMMNVPVGVGGKSGASGSHQPNTSGNLSPSVLHTPKVTLAFGMHNFSYNDLSTATGGFSQLNLLGQGGFGYVYKGVLPDGHEVAVKSLKSDSNQGEREFQAEVETISRVHHRHLVSLVGYCIADAQRMLVYEYVPNRTLDFHLHERGCHVMKWKTRIRIALGLARGVAYLHEDCIFAIQILYNLGKSLVYNILVWIIIGMI